MPGSGKDGAAVTSGARDADSGWYDWDCQPVVDLSRSRITTMSLYEDFQTLVARNPLATRQPLAA